MDIPHLEVVFAESFRSRLRGLTGVDPRDLYPLVFPACRSIHTFGMRAAIDVVWLDLRADGVANVLAVDLAVAPRRLVQAPRWTPRRRTAALELAAGDAQRLALEPGSPVALTRR